MVTKNGMLKLQSDLASCIEKIFVVAYFLFVLHISHMQFIYKPSEEFV